MLLAAAADLDHSAGAPVFLVVGEGGGGVVVVVVLWVREGGEGVREGGDGSAP